MRAPVPKDAASEGLCAACRELDCFGADCLGPDWLGLALAGLADFGPDGFGPVCLGGASLTLEDTWVLEDTCGLESRASRRLAEGGES